MTRVNPLKINIAEETSVVQSSAISYTGSALLELAVDSNFGICIWLRIWAKTDTGSADTEIPFRALIHQKTDKVGREIVWNGMSMARQTSTTAITPAAQDYIEVNTNDIMESDEGVVIYDNDSRYEFARINTRTSGQINLHDDLTDASQYDSGDLVLVVSEWNNVPWYNTDTDSADQNKILLEVIHDGEYGDDDLVFYAQALAVSQQVTY
jgi:hypothetical protein